jgi:hypothetical protein
MTAQRSPIGTTWIDSVFIVFRLSLDFTFGLDDSCQFLVSTAVSGTARDAPPVWLEQILEVGDAMRRPQPRAGMVSGSRLLLTEG